jgi:hypothetical protein
VLSGWLVPGLYRGAGITLLRDVPAYAIYFTSYEACHELFAPGSRASGEQTALVQLVGGGLAGVLSWLGIYHFDVVKTRLQSQPRASSPYSGASCFCMLRPQAVRLNSVCGGSCTIAYFCWRVLRVYCILLHTHIYVSICDGSWLVSRSWSLKELVSPHTEALGVLMELDNVLTFHICSWLSNSTS